MSLFQNRKKNRLILKDGRQFVGWTVGADASATGEVVFNTGMVGYPESITDPSYAGQILTFSYPLIGNYGIPSFEQDSNSLLKFFESDKIQVAGLITGDLSLEFSHHTAISSLSDLLKEQNIPCITGIDTRALTKHIRRHGVMPAVILPETSPVDNLQFADPNDTDLVSLVSRDEVTVFGEGDIHIVAVDCGIKNNIIREFLNHDIKLTVVPADYDFNKLKYDGLFISNGPGDPEQVTYLIHRVKKALDDNKPIFGICLGTQIIALAAGANTYKLKYGHRSQNQPCIDQSNGRCYITSQNHGYAIEVKSLPKDWQQWFINANDGTCEGIIHQSKPISAVQFHPEAVCGPTDTRFLFDRFIGQVREYTGVKND